MGRNRLYLLDGHSYLYRAYHALPFLSNSKGLPTHAVYGFTNMLYRIIRERNPDYLAVAFDSGKPTQRHRVFEAYKAQRPPMPESLGVQLPYVQKVVQAFRIPMLLEEGVEADDLIGTVASVAEAGGIEVVIVSGDKDMFQLVSAGIQIYDSFRERMYGEAEVLEKFGVQPAQVVEVMALMGDTVDNVPGVPGVGEKTAVALIRQFGNIDSLLSRLDEVKKPKLRENLRNFSEQIRMNRQLVKLDLNVPWEGQMADLRLVHPDRQALKRLFTELEFSRLLKNFSLLDPENDEAPASANIQSATHDSLGPRGDKAGETQRERNIEPDEFTRIASERGQVSVVSIHDFPPAEDPVIHGIAFSCGSGTSLYLSLREPDSGRSGPAFSSLPLLDLGAASESWNFIRDLLEEAGIGKVGHDLKSLLRIVARSGIKTRGIHFDTMVASYLLTPGRRSHDLSVVCEEYLGRSVVPPDQSRLENERENACATAEAVLELSVAMQERLGERGQSRLYHEVELPLVEVLSEMEQNGFKVDRGILEELSKELEIQIQGLIQRINRLAGGEFNLNSPKQLSEVLFERLKLKPVRKTKTGYSTDETVLSQLALIHELPAEILNYRQLAKLRSTYVDALPQLVHPQTGRLHTTFHQTITATGRLSSSDPNLQNIPIRGEWGHRIRQAFVTEKGNYLLSSDYNQIELRILAHLSRDEQLVKAFAEEQDIHAATAATLFNLPPHLISPEMRRAAKTVNFGVIYGMGPYALSAELGTSQTEAKRYIESYFEHYAGVRQFIENTIQEARQNGYVTTLLNRRRAIPEILASEAVTRSQGERIAVNTLIQGSAADLMKLAMVRIFREMKEAALRSKMILQVHDELIFEVCEGELDVMKGLVSRQMEEVLPLRIPIKVDLALGRNWAEIH